MFVRRSAALVAMAAAAPAALAWMQPYTCPTNNLITPGSMTTWKTTGKTWPNAIPAQGSSSFVYFPDGCGAGGEIGVRFYRAGPSSTFSTYFNNGDYQDYAGQPAGANPDTVMEGIFGTYQQSNFVADGPIQSIRMWEPDPYDIPPGNGFHNSFSFGIDIDYTKSDCTSMGAPQAGASYAGSFLGFSDYFSGCCAGDSTKTTMTFTATKAGGGAGSDFANWELFNSNQGTIGETGAIYEQSWTGTSSNGVLKGTNTPAPDGDNPFGSTDCNLALVTLSNIELYSTISIVVSTTNGGNDYIGFLGGSITTNCPPGSILGADGVCYPCPEGTYFDDSVEPPMCVPCPKGQTTFGCGASSIDACHKPCGPGSYYNPAAVAAAKSHARGSCTKCPTGTFWPATGFGKGTPFYETDTCIPCSGSRKVGATTCAAYTAKAKGAAKNKTTKSWKE